VTLYDFPNSPAFGHIGSLLPVFCARDRRRDHPTRPVIWDARDQLSQTGTVESIELNNGHNSTSARHI
jgi:hypothetical protein